MRQANNLCRVACLFATVLLAGCAADGPSQGAYQKTIKAADETAAIQLLRTVTTAQAQSKSTRGVYGEFESLVQAGLLDQRFAGREPEINGYRFNMRATESEFSLTADPLNSSSASRYFYVDSVDGAIRVNPAKPATKTDPAL